MRRQVIVGLLEASVFVAIGIVAIAGGRGVAWILEADDRVTYQSATIELKNGTIIEATNPDEVERSLSDHKGEIQSSRLRGMFSEKSQVIGLTTMTFTFILIAIWAIYQHRASLKAWFQPSWRAIAFGLLAVGGMEATKLVWGFALTASGVTLPNWSNVNAWGPIAYPVLLIFMMGIVGPMAEEIYFRGRLLDLIRDWFGHRSSLITTSVIFAALHPLGWFTPLFLLFGFSLAYLRVWTGGLIAPIVAHVVFNMIAVVRVLLAGPSA